MNKEQTLYPESWQIPPMKYCSKASDLAARRAFESGDWIGQEKKDGALYCLEKTDSGYVYLFSRTKSRKTGELVEKSDNFLHIKEWAETYVPNGTIFVGEIYIPGGHSNTVTKLSGCLPTKAYKRQFDETDPDYLGPAHYYIFDIIRYNGEDIQKKGTLERIENYLYNESLEYSFAHQRYVERAETFYDNFEEHLQKIFNEGGEGIVFKNKTCSYRAGKRSTSSQMFKWKQHLDSVDLICIGLEDPIFEYSGKEIKTWLYWMERSETIDGKSLWYPVEGQYYNDYIHNPHIYKPVTKPAFYGWKNSLSLGCYRDGKIVYVGKVASGLTDTMRKDMAEHPENYLNNVVEIECMSVDSKEGTIRHPTFRQMRYDKNTEECLWEDIFK